MQICFFIQLWSWYKQEIHNFPNYHNLSINVSRNVKKWIKYIKRSRFQQKSMSGIAWKAKKILICLVSSAAKQFRGSTKRILTQNSHSRRQFFHSIIIGWSQKSCLLIGWELRSLQVKFVKAIHSFTLMFILILYANLSVRITVWAKSHLSLAYVIVLGFSHSDLLSVEVET